MSIQGLTIGELAEHILATPRSGRRRLVAVAGAPASGKSTLAKELASELCSMGCSAQVVPLDGFHLHNQILSDRGLLPIKGAPSTFDAQGFAHLVGRLHNDPDIYYPVFDRAQDIAIAGAGYLNELCDTVIVEGNYLLYNVPIWKELYAHWDLSLRLDVPLETLRERLVGRWLEHGLSTAQAQCRAEDNDLANAALIARAQLPADITI